MLCVSTFTTIQPILPSKVFWIHPLSLFPLPFTGLSSLSIFYLGYSDNPLTGFPNRTLILSNLFILQLEWSSWNPSLITSPPAQHPTITVMYKKRTAPRSQKTAFITASCWPHRLNFWHSWPTAITLIAVTIPSAPDTWCSLSCLDLRVKLQHVGSSSIYQDSKPASTPH